MIFRYLLVFSLIALGASTLSKSSKKHEKGKKKKSPVTESPDSNVIEKGLVTKDLRDVEIIKYHGQYCEKQKDGRLFNSGEVLAYVTPWNSHGYDIAKTVGKFTMVSPVWLQIKRKPRGMYNVEGTHDIDKGWIKELKKKSLVPKIVPRVLFDGWSESDYKSLFGSEDEIESMTNAIVQELKDNDLDGAVIEVWSQIGNKHPKELIHVLTHMSEIFHSHKLLIILVVPAAISKEQKVVSTFRDEEFAELAPLIDFFSVMTYDFSTNVGQAGPSAPSPWMKACVELLDPTAKHRQKILMGLNFYGYMFTSNGAAAIIGKQYLEFLNMYSPEIVWEKNSEEHYSQFGDKQSGSGVVFYPSLQSIQTRLDLARTLGSGISIWEIGQGLDYFFDLL